MTDIDLDCARSNFESCVSYGIENLERARKTDGLIRKHWLNAARSCVHNAELAAEFLRGMETEREREGAGE